ncbi:Uncharacterised protein [Mycobacteroides abscessus subsp. abscessus]|nr:Uncharacterised protein [Mycobacteroides abscessus subsp. abscessus]
MLDVPAVNRSVPLSSICSSERSTVVCAFSTSSNNTMPGREMLPSTSSRSKSVKPSLAPAYPGGAPDSDAA